MLNLNLSFATVLMGMLVLFNSSIVTAQNFGGPDAVENVIEDDAQIRPAVVEKRASQKWFEWKQGVQEEYGFAIGLDYTPLYLKSSENGASGVDNASSGMLRVFGSCDLIGRGIKNTGALVWKIENRHSYTDVSPQGFGFDQGYAGLIEPPFSDEGTLLQKSLSVGLGYNAFGGRDQLGVALNWGEANESFGEDLKDQTVLETYYRFQLTKQFAITPDVQYLIDPALNPEHDRLWVFGLRTRLAL
jgi:hypothetical protein